MIHIAMTTRMLNWLEKHDVASERHILSPFVVLRDFVVKNYLPACFAQESRRETARLKTGCEGVESRESRQK